jgi:tetratricopeptide (TPR) repeat protein
MRHFRGIILLGVLITLGCGNKRQALTDKIVQMEKNTDEYNKPYLDSLTHLYEKFVTDYPKDSMAAHYLYSAANNNSSQASAGDARYVDIALEEYKKIVTDYPSSKEAATSLFRIGSIYENDKKDTATARQYYEKYLAQYPEGEYANDVRIILNSNYLGKSAEQIFLDMQKAGKIQQDSGVQATIKAD